MEGQSVEDFTTMFIGWIKAHEPLVKDGLARSADRRIEEVLGETPAGQAALADLDARIVAFRAQSTHTV